MTNLPKHIRYIILVYAVTAFITGLEGILAAVTALRPFITGARVLSGVDDWFAFLPGLGLGLGFFGFLVVPVVITALGMRRRQSWARTGGIVISLVYIALIVFTMINGEFRFGPGLALHAYVLWALLLHEETRTAFTVGPLDDVEKQA